MILDILRVRIKSEDMKKSCLNTSDSILNIKNVEFSVYYIFFGFLTCFFQILDTACNTRRSWHHNSLLYSHSVKLTACEDITFIQWIKPGISERKCYKRYFVS